MPAILTDDMKRIIEEQRLGFVASVDADGTPNLSPKATFSVLDDHSIGFCELRSPQTMANLARGSLLEVNFVDPFVRKGYRFKGSAEVVPRGAPGFDVLAAKFVHHGTVIDRTSAIVVLRIDRALPLVSPAYDGGRSDEDAIRESWTRRFRAIQPGGKFVE